MNAGAICRSLDPELEEHNQISYEGNWNGSMCDKLHVTWVGWHCSEHKHTRQEHDVQLLQWS